MAAVGHLHQINQLIPRLTARYRQILALVPSASVPALNDVAAETVA